MNTARKLVRRVPTESEVSAWIAEAGALPKVVEHWRTEEDAMFHLSFFGIIGSVIVGAIVGWLAGKIMTGKGFGLGMDIVLGVASGLIVSLVLGVWLGDNGPGWIVRFILSLLVACGLVALVHLFRKEPIRTA